MSAPPSASAAKPRKWPVFWCKGCYCDVLNAFSHDSYCTECGGDKERVPGARPRDTTTEAEWREIFAEHEELSTDESCMNFSTCAGCPKILSETTGNYFCHIFEARPKLCGQVVPAYKSQGTNFCSYRCLVNFCVERKKEQEEKRKDVRMV